MNQLPQNELISKIIELRIKPVIQSHGGDIRFVSYDEPSKSVWVELQGTCTDCPNAMSTLKGTVESFLRLVLTDDINVRNINEQVCQRGEDDDVQ